MDYQNYLDLTGRDLRHLESCYFRVGTQVGADHLKEMGTPTKTKAQRADYDALVEAYGLTLFAVSYQRHIASAEARGLRLYAVSDERHIARMLVEPDPTYADHVAYGHGCQHLHIPGGNKYILNDDWLEAAHVTINDLWDQVDPLAQIMYGYEKLCEGTVFGYTEGGPYRPGYSDGRLRYLDLLD